MKYLPLLVLLFLASCKKKETFPVAPIKMVKVLADVHLAEAAVQNLKGKLKDSMTKVYYRQIWEIHGIRQEDFDSTMTLLKKNPKFFEKVYVKVKEEIDKKSVKMND